MNSISRWKYCELYELMTEEIVIKSVMICKSNMSSDQIFSLEETFNFLRQTNLNLRIYIENRKTQKNIFDFWNFIWSLMGMDIGHIDKCNIASSTRMYSWECVKYVASSFIVNRITILHCISKSKHQISIQLFGFLLHSSVHCQTCTSHITLLQNSQLVW